MTQATSNSSLNEASSEETQKEESKSGEKTSQEKRKEDDDQKIKGELERRNELREDLLLSQLSLQKLKNFEKDVKPNHFFLLKRTKPKKLHSKEQLEEDAKFIHQKTKETIENFRKSFREELDEFKAEAEFFKTAIKAAKEKKEEIQKELQKGPETHGNNGGNTS